MAKQVNYKRTTITGLLWKFGERIGAELITLVVQIILMRILLPEDFGVVALTTVFIRLCNVFVSTGFGSALVQKKDADDLDYSSVFYASLVISLILYAIIFFTSPYIAQWLESPQLKDILRVVAIQVPISAFVTVQNAYISKHFLFKKYFWSTLIGTLISAGVGITMAYTGCGAWAIVGQHLTNFVIDRIVLFFTVKWRPRWMFSWKRTKGLMKYGWKLLGAGLLDVGYGELQTIIIGKKYTPADLAYYSKGRTYPGMIVENLNGPITSVLFPVMSDMQENKEKVKNVTRRAIKTSSYMLFPMLMGLAVVAPVFVPVLVTDKWNEMIPYMQIMCFIYAFYPIHTANLQAIKALGRSDMFLKLEIIKKVIGLVALIISMWFGVLWIALSGIITTIISSIINAFPNKKLLNYSWGEQMKDILPYFGLAILMGAPVYAMNYLYLSLGWNMYLVLVLQILAGIIIYVGCSMLFRVETFKYLLNTIKEFFKKRKNKPVVANGEELNVEVVQVDENPTEENITETSTESEQGKEIENMEEENARQEEGLELGDSKKEE